jgi:hypothetical protein
VTDKDQEKTGRRFGRTRTALRKIGGLYVYSLLGDVPGEINRKRSLWKALHDMATGKLRTRSESFEQAVRRNGADSEALAARASTLGWMSALYFTVAVVAFVMLLASPWVAKPLSQFLMSLGVFAMCLAKGLVARFRMFQIRERKLIGFRDWLERGRQ